MSNQELKIELKELIDRESDEQVLNAIYTILQKFSRDQQLKENLTRNAIISNQDIEEGRTFTSDEVIKRTDEMIKK